MVMMPLDMGGRAMDETEGKLQALELQVGRLQAEVMALRISGSYVAHALTAALVKRDVIHPRDVIAMLEFYAEGFEQDGGRSGEMSTIRAEVAETLRRQATEIERVVGAFAEPRPN
jgi:hypothetical protein